MKKIMKKTICIFLLSVVVSFSFTCCNNEKITIKICGFSDSIPENSHILEYGEWSKDTFSNENASKTAEIKIGDNYVTGEYIDSEKRFSEFFSTHRYRDDNNNYFSINDDGKLNTYFFGKNNSDNAPDTICTEEECINIAKSFVSELCEISQYDIASSFNEERSMYTVTFLKYLDGFRCSDSAEVVVDSNGSIYSFTSTMLGMMNVQKKTDFNKEDIENKIISKLDKEYTKARQVYDKIVYNSFNYELTIDDKGDYALICSVDVQCKQIDGEYIEVQSELIRFLIQLA